MKTRNSQFSLVSARTMRMTPLLALIFGALVQVPAALAQCPPDMTLQPIAQSECVGSTATFQCAAVGTGLTYRWARSTGGSGFLNLSDNARISGATTNTLTVTGLDAGDQGSYRCRVFSTCGSNTDADIVQLTVLDPAVVTTQPQSQSSCLGGSLTFSAAATGDGLTYRWARAVGGNGMLNITEGGRFTGTTSPTLNITGIVAGDAGNYRCRVVSPCGNVDAEIASLTISAAPAITTQPSPQVVCSGNTATFQVAASGAGLTYLWARAVGGNGMLNINEGGRFSGTTSNTLTVTGVVPGDVGNYRCRVVGTCGTVDATVVGLSLKDAVVTTQPVPQTVCAGNTATFQVAATGSNLTYLWARAVGGFGYLNINEGGRFSGTNTPTLTVTGVVPGDQGNYRCRIFSDCATVDANIVALNIGDTVITTQPVSQTPCTGGTATFQAAASGSNLTYLWARSVGGVGFLNINEGGRFSGTNTPTLTVTGVVAGDQGRYRCRILSDCATVDADIVRLDIGDTVVASGPQDVNTCPHGTATFSASVTGTNLTYLWARAVGGNGFLNINEGGRFSGTNTDTLVITDVQDGDQGQYRCRTFSDCGTVDAGIAHLGVCAADFNCDGGVDFFDYLDFVDAFSNNDPAADFNGDTSIDFFDYLDFVDSFSIGCN